MRYGAIECIRGVQNTRHVLFYGYASLCDEYRWSLDVSYGHYGIMIQ